MRALVLSVVLIPIAIRFAKRRGHPNDLKVVAVLATLVNVVWVPSQFRVDTHVWNVVVFFLLGWLATFKAIGCAYDRGPLSADGLTLLGTFVTYALPINPVTSDQVGEARKRKSTIRYAWDALRHCILLVCGTAVSHRLQKFPYGGTGTAHMLASDLVDSINLYAFIAVIMNVASIGTVQAGDTVLGFSKIMSHCDRPWLATTFGEFWSRRWNINTGYTLRYLIYDPVCEGSMAAAGGRVHRDRCSNARRVAALASTFAVSGVVHECFIYWLRGVHSGHGRWFLFFFLQVPLIVLVDPWLKGLRKRSVSMARAVTIGGQLILAHHLFFLPVVELGITDDIHGGVNYGIRMVLGDSLCARLYPAFSS